MGDSVECKIFVVVWRLIMYYLANDGFTYDMG